MIDRKFSKKSTSKNSIKLEHLSSKKIINKAKAVKEEPKYNCIHLKLGCNMIYSKKDLIKHLEIDCEYFRSNASFKMYSNLPKLDKSQRMKLSGLIINKAHSLETESIENEYFQHLVENQSVKELAKYDSNQLKSISSKRFSFVKDVANMESILLGQTPLKQNSTFILFCVIVKNKTSRNYLAFRNKFHQIEVRDMLNIDEQYKLLNGHTDVISEIKFYQTVKTEMSILITSSFDKTVRVWNINNDFKQIHTINFESWVMSAIYLHDKYKTEEDLIVCCGGFYKQYPIKVYLLSGEFLYQINIQENCLPIILNYIHDEDFAKTFIFCGTDGDLPIVQMYDLHSKEIVRIFKAQAAITSLTIHTISSANSTLLYTDFAGYVRLVDVSTGKLLGELKTGNVCLDLTMLDDDNYIVCGDKENNFKIYIKSKNRLSRSYEKIHSKAVLNIMKYTHPHYGFCLFSIGADKKLKIFNK